jgi:hypothetical protein
MHFCVAGMRLLAAASATLRCFVLVSPSGGTSLVLRFPEIPECRSTNRVVTVSPEDLTSSSGLATVSAALVTGAPVKAFGVPQPDGSSKAYVLFYLTGTQLSS